MKVIDLNSLRKTKTAPRPGGSDFKELLALTRCLEQELGESRVSLRHEIVTAPDGLRYAWFGGRHAHVFDQNGEAIGQCTISDTPNVTPAKALQGINRVIAAMDKISWDD